MTKPPEQARDDRVMSVVVAVVLTVFFVAWGLIVLNAVRIVTEVLP